ncbi:hypothetical protein CQ018_03215 [Arthrobacter sp. MYb227]|uniref:hypothetical protein n=1 Tax=Arthrobacter sp. MYb227 TaxID=1848601 RepID=UPI000CFBB8EE|nr:hypothetical protein [Arthrobacter sp. MYb227]PQZ96292.1 hypothetical protein CQ018_03215 [Arthrobacter sp. MYb227]
MMKPKNVPAAGPDMSLQEFEAERDRVCGDFADHELAKQPGQLGRSEYVLVGILLAVSFALVLLLQ